MPSEKAQESFIALVFLGFFLHSFDQKISVLHLIKEWQMTRSVFRDHSLFDIKQILTVVI